METSSVRDFKTTPPLPSSTNVSREIVRCPLVGILQIDHHFDMMVLAPSRVRNSAISIIHLLRRRVATTCTSSLPPTSCRGTATTGIFFTKQCLAEFADAWTLGTAVVHAAELETFIPPRRRLELLTITPLAAQPFVDGTLFHIPEHSVRLADFIKVRLRVVELAQVRVVFASLRYVRLISSCVMLRGTPNTS
nr:hypothetical protein [Paraburkholderia sp. WP4_3_2]